MTLTAVLKLSFSNLWRRKLRTILTVWGMSVGIGAMVLLISFASGLQKQNEAELTKSISLTTLTVTKEKQEAFQGSGSAPSGFTSQEIDQLRAIDHVLAVYPNVNPTPLKVEIDGQRLDVFLQPTPLEQITEDKRQQIEQGAWWTANNDPSIVVTATTLEHWKLAPSAAVGKKVKLIAQLYGPTGASDGKTYEATIIGVTKKQAGFSIFGDAVAFDLGAQIARENVSAFIGEPVSDDKPVTMTVFVDDADNVAAVRQAITDQKWFSSGLEELLETINRSFLIMKIVLGVIGGIALFVALIGIANSMLMAVLERTREIGIMTALGASRRTVSTLFLSEAGWLGVFGALLGIAGAYAIGQAITVGISAYLSFSNNDGSELSFIKFSISLGLFGGTLLGAIAVTLIAGWLPARRAAGLDPIKALRHE